MTARPGPSCSTRSLGAGAEDQVALRAGGRARWPGSSPVRRTRPAGGEAEPFELTFTERGTLDNLVRRPIDRRPAGRR